MSGQQRTPGWHVRTGWSSPPVSTWKVSRLAVLGDRGDSGAIGVQRGMNTGAEAQIAPRTRRGSHVEVGHDTGTKVIWRSHKGILKVSCADDLSRGEGPSNEMVAEGVSPTHLILKGPRAMYWS